jgi:hypothetical protein
MGDDVPLGENVTEALARVALVFDSAVQLFLRNQLLLDEQLTEH